jgi:ferric-dicitrate binding protein FerR (iron transport regulator)
MPFIATVNNAEIEVLGTHFNIMGYDDEQAMKTTLLEGSVRVKPSIGDQQATMLKPGQQALISQPSNRSHKIPVQTIQVQAVDVDEAVAWKNGMFQFNNTDIPAIMRQVSRWYDVEVTYENNMPIRSFSGEISRDVPLTKMLQLLELSDVRFRVEGKKIIVLH